jgi:hypothetical protein
LDSARASGSRRRDLLAALTGAAAWCSTGTVAFTSGGADRVAALPPLAYLIAAMALAIVAARVLRLRLSDAWPLAISFLVFLPFIPGPIPPALMLFQGPIEVVVWILVGVGLLTGRARNGVAVKHSPWIAAALVAGISWFAFAQVRAVVPSGDEPHYLVATQSVIGDRDLKVENNYASGDYLEYFSGRLQPHFLQRSSGGEIYSIHAPGVSALVLPGFLIAGYAGAVATVIVIVALTAALTWMVAWRVSQSAAAAWIGLLAVFATAPFLFHTFTIYPDGVGSLMVIGAVWLLARLDDSDLPHPQALVLIGAGLALLPWLHTRFALLAAVFGAAVIASLLMRRAPIGSVIAFLAVPIVAATAWFAFFWMIWGTPSPLAPYGRDTESSLSYIGRGLSGLMFDQQHGVIGTAPIYAVALVGLWPLLKQQRSLAVTILLAALTYLIAVSTYAMWWGGTSAPARFVAAILPIAAVLIAMTWSSFPRLRAAILALLVVSIALVIPRLTEDAGRLVYNSRSAFDPTIEWLSRNVDLSAALPSGHRDSPVIVFRDAMPWLFAIAIVAVGSFAVSRKNLSDGFKWTMVVFGAAVSVIAATTFVWMMRDAQPITPDRAVLAALSSQRPWHSTMADASRWSSLSREEFLMRLSIEVKADQAAALARLRRIPAGEYLISSTDNSAGAFAAVVNRNDPAIEVAMLPYRLRLPVPVSTLSVRGETAASMRITPVALAASAADGRAAIRGARYGRARVFVFDETAYLEPKGFWTRGEGRAIVAIDADDDARRSGLPIVITGGAAATTIGISVGEWSRSYSMTPGQRREITLPPLQGESAWIVNIHSGPGFRPFQHEQGSTDVRLLAAWFEIP